MVMNDTAARRLERRVGLTFLRDVRFKREAELIAPFLDTEFYLSNNADVADAGIDASLHYAKYGWREGRDPSPGFSTKDYLLANPKLAREGVNPLLHFVKGGSVARSKAPGAPDEAEVSLVGEHIDAAFYAANTAAFDKDGQSAAAHYCQFGWRTGADPAPDFSTSYYLTTNPDVRERGINPFWHFLTAGRDEGRLPLHPGGWRHRVLSQQTTFAAYCDEWIRRDMPGEIIEGEMLVERLSAALSRRRLMLSIGHDDYREAPGGVQLCIAIEEEEAARRDVDYLNLHPWQALPKLADPEDDPLLVLALNGHDLGLARASQVASALGALPRAAEPPELVIHHLAGHAPETIVAIAESLEVKHARLWLHDYFTLCTSYALQRNNVSSCSAPDAASNACGICLFGQQRIRQAARIEALFADLDVEVVSPSQTALDFWRSRTALKPIGQRVQPHVALTAAPGDEVKTASDDTPVRIAFIGTQVPHKGWPVFLELQRRLQTDPSYEFWCFGVQDPKIPELRHVEAHVRADDPDAMFRAIADHDIDLVLHWAAWRETFSFSTFEALGGGAFVLTNAGSGNVAAAVTEFDRGAVLDNASALYALAEAGGLRDLAKRARVARHDRALEATFSAMTFALPERERRA
ncbi:MAG: hypothetical protein AAGA06_09820 [Pseudomonadota bacterium]